MKKKMAKKGKKKGKTTFDKARSKYFGLGK
jgi:hypothetical protein